MGKVLDIPGRFRYGCVTEKVKEARYHEGRLLLQRTHRQRRIPLPEDMALLKRLFAHGSLPPKAQLRGKRCWLYLRVNTNNPAADEIGISGQDTYLRQFAEVNSMQIVGVYKDYMCGWDLRRPSLRFLAREAAEKKMDYILSCKQDRIYRGHDLRGLLQYEDHMHALGVDILYPFEQD